MIICSSLMMCKFISMKTNLHPESKIPMMDINELCVSPDMIWTSIAVLGSWGNINVNYLVDIIVPPFGIPSVIGELLAVVC